MEKTILSASALEGTKESPASCARAIGILPPILNCQIVSTITNQHMVYVTTEHASATPTLQVRTVNSQHVKHAQIWKNVKTNVATKVYVRTVNADVSKGVQEAIVQ